MRKVGKFLMSIVVFIVMLVIMVAGTIIAGVLYAKAGGGSVSILDFLLNLNSQTQDTDFLMLTNLIYAVIGVIIFGLWYWFAFIKPFRNKPKNYTGGFNPWTILALVIIGFGLSFIGTMIIDGISNAAPSIGSSYQAYMTLHFGELNPQTLLYVVILGPIVEELIFRGLIYRYTRLAAPFIVANIWQAVLFGLVHGTPIQMLYAFVMGLVLGLLVHRGHGIRYTIVLHMIINCLGMLLGDFFEAIPQIYPAGIHAAVFAGTAFAIVVFWMEFGPAKEEHAGNGHHSNHTGYAEHTGHPEHPHQNHYSDDPRQNHYSDDPRQDRYPEQPQQIHHSSHSRQDYFYEDEEPVQDRYSDDLGQEYYSEHAHQAHHSNRAHHSDHSGYRTEIEDLD